MTIDDSRKYIYRGYTLIDITNTGVTKNNPDQIKQRNQQRNWETVQQLLGLHTQILELEQQKLKPQDMTRYEFGSVYTGVHNIWRFDFTVEFNDIFSLNGDPVGILKLDFDSIPILLNLDETIKPEVAIFNSTNEYKNIYFIPYKVK